VFFIVLDLRLTISARSGGLFFMPFTTLTTLHLLICRKTPSLSQQPQDKNQQMFANLPKTPYLCQRKQAITPVTAKQEV